MKILQHLDSSESAILATAPREGDSAVELGSQVVVDEGQVAVFLVGDEPMDVLVPGQHVLAPSLLPVLAALPESGLEESSSFRATVVFVTSRPSTELRWGTREPMEYRDDEMGLVELRAFGRVAVRIDRPKEFVRQIVGVSKIRTTAELEDRIRRATVGRLTELLEDRQGSILELPEAFPVLVDALGCRVTEDLAGLGMTLVDLSVGAIRPPREIRRLMDERTGRKTLAEMGAHADRRMASAETTSAEKDSTAPVEPCHECGRSLAAGDNYCPACGTRARA